MFGLVLRPAFADHVQQEAYVEQSTLDWTVVRPGAFATGAQTGVYRHGFVERTFAWLGNYRRLSKDYETLSASSEAFLPR